MSKSLADLPLNIPVDVAVWTGFDNEPLVLSANLFVTCPKGDENGVDDERLANPIPCAGGDRSGDVSTPEDVGLSLLDVAGIDENIFFVSMDDSICCEGSSIISDMFGVEFDVRTGRIGKSSSGFGVPYLLASFANRSYSRPC